MKQHDRETCLGGAVAGGSGPAPGARSRSDIGLVSGPDGGVTRSLRAVVTGRSESSAPPVWHVIVITFDDLLGELAACGAGSFWPAPEARGGPPRARTGGRPTVTKNFSGPGFESSAGRELHPTCAVPIRVSGTDGGEGGRDLPGTPVRFDGVLIAV